MSQDSKLSPAASRIQRVFRLFVSKFRNYGVHMFVDAKGLKAPHGRLVFEGASLPPRPFLCVSDTTSTAVLTQFIYKFWQLPLPEVLITITGGAQDFVLSSRLQREFTKGLVSAAASTNAWVVTGGTDTGVMKLVAQAFNDGGTEVEHVPLIAVTPYGCVNGRGVLENNPGQVRAPARPRAV